MGSSTKNFDHFRKEMDRLGKQLRAVERDTADWKEKYESSNEQVGLPAKARGEHPASKYEHLFFFSGAEDESDVAGEGEGAGLGQEEAGGHGEAEPDAAGREGRAHEAATKVRRRLSSLYYCGKMIRADLSIRVVHC